MILKPNNSNRSLSVSEKSLGGCAKPETLNLIRATDFTVRRLKGDRPLGNSIGALLGHI